MTPTVSGTAAPGKDGFKTIDFAARRAHFFSELVRETENAVAIVPANPELIRNSDVSFKFRQDSNFYYLTGFDEPDAIAVFRNVKGKRQFTLFVRPKDLENEIWTGFRCGVDDAVVKYGADQAFRVDEFDAQFLKLLQGTDRVFYGFNRSMNRNGSEYLDQKMFKLLDQYRQSLGRTGRGLVPVYDVQEILGEMRLFKAPEEMDRIRRASHITARAHREAMVRCHPGVTEAQLEAFIEYLFRNDGADRFGYPSIVATGANATVLHYVENNKPTKDGDLLLVDAGAELEYYGADITRTFPVNGKFTAPQKELYQITLDVQKECIQMARPGQTLAAIHMFVVEQLTDAMLRLKLLDGSRPKIIEGLAYKRYYPHNTSHFLGMDVHDLGLYQRDGNPRLLEPGMLFTIEPGFYVLQQDTQAPEKYRGIGIRIEDDILITPEGNEVTTTLAPKEVAEIEAIVGSKPWLEP